MPLVQRVIIGVVHGFVFIVRRYVECVWVHGAEEEEDEETLKVVRCSGKVREIVIRFG